MLYPKLRGISHGRFQLAKPYTINEWVIRSRHEIAFNAHSCVPIMWLRPACYTHTWILYHVGFSCNVKRTILLFPVGLLFRGLAVTYWFMFPSKILDVNAAGTETTQCLVVTGGMALCAHALVAQQMYRVRSAVGKLLQGCSRRS